MGLKMPTYDYECKRCGIRFERFQRMSDAPLEVCPECGGTVERLIGAGGAVIFKGPGFHATDYNGAQPGCGSERPCCGRDTRCDRPPCDHLER
jgi:putative FmdB family regulatory protein